MQSNLEIINAVIEQDEGGWVLSRDADGGDGGWTFGGIARTTWERVTPTRRDYDAMKNAMANPELKSDLINQGCAIYQSEFWPAWMDQVGTAHRQMFFSMLINRNPIACVKAIQAACYAGVDGKWGDNTLFRYQRFNTASDLRDPRDEPPSFPHNFCKEWMQQYIDICVHNPAKIQFLSGWFNRVLRYWR